MLPNWIPQRVGFISEFSTGEKPTADDINTLFNVLIAQGNHNADQIAVLTTAVQDLQVQVTSLTTG